MSCESEFAQHEYQLAVREKHSPKMVENAHGDASPPFQEKAEDSMPELQTLQKQNPSTQRTVMRKAAGQSALTPSDLLPEFTVNGGLGRAHEGVGV